MNWSVMASKVSGPPEADLDNNLQPVSEEEGSMNIRTLMITSAVLTLCCMTAQAQIAFGHAIDIGYSNGPSRTFSYTPGTGETIAVLCISGDTIGGHDDISTVQYAGNNMTFVGEYSAAGGHTNSYLYLYKYLNPPAGASTITLGFTNTHQQAGVMAGYKGAADLLTPTHVKTYGPDATSPVSHTGYVSFSGSWILDCDGGYLAAAGTNETYRVRSGFEDFPTLFDFGPVNPAPRAVSMTTSWDDSAHPSGSHYNDDARIMAELTPSGSIPFLSTQAEFTSTNSWVYNATDSGATSCDYAIGMWDTTTSPYNNITSSATISCDGSYNITATFAGNQTGTMVLVPNPSSCGGGTC